MVMDWLDREVWIVFSWWAWVTLAGVAVMPLCVRLLGALPDKGYTLARAAGLLIVGFVFWTLAVLGFVSNSAGSIALAWGIVLVASLAIYTALPGERFDVRAWFRQNRSAVIIGEVLFVVMLLGWAVFRAYYPALTATEKPMELAFMSAVQRSETFPPNDPWMSGYAISYYHFGYIMTAALSMLSGIPSTTGFNMMIALLFALTGLTAFGVVYNLVRSRGAMGGVAASVGVLATVFVTLLSNYQLPLIEIPYQSALADDAYFQFWDVQDRTQAREFIPETTPTVNVAGLEIADPARWDFWWWFRASRVINDRHLPREVDGQTVAPSVGANVIDEFPAFSFILADVHPHVLALPFSVLALGLALNLLLQGRNPTLPQIVFYGLAMGGLMFLNMWDGPIYMVVLLLAEALRRVMAHRGLTADDWPMLILFLVTLVGLAFFFYLPFFISFRSQASGILPNVEWPTLFRQLFIMFGPFVMILTPFLLLEWWRGRGQMNWRAGWSAAGLVFGGLLALVILLVGVGYLSPAFRPVIDQFIAERGGLSATVNALIMRRFSHGLTTLLLLAALALVIARIYPRTEARKLESQPVTYTPTTGFALLLVFAAVGLVLVPEFIYLRDNFGVRINTIFKFYYQAWGMFAVAGAYGVYNLFAVHPEHGRPPLPLRVIAAPVLALSVFLGLLYPVLGIHNRTQIESGRGGGFGQPLTLDGGTSIANGDDYRAIMCLAELEPGDDAVVAEAIGPAYRWAFGRVGTLTGIPIVLGWEGHQRQWRGPTYNQVAGTRREDIQTLYNDPRWDVARQIIDRYDIDYIFYGTTERAGTSEVPAFNAAGEDKFIENLEPVCQFGDSLFYRVTPRALQTVEGGL